MQNPWEYCMYSKICNADNQPSWPKCVQFSRRVEKNVGNVSKFGSPRMSLFLPKIIVVDCIEKMSEEIPDRLGSTAYLLNLMKAFCTHCCIQYYWLQVSAFWTQNTIREWEQISPKKNKDKAPLLFTKEFASWKEAINSAWVLISLNFSQNQSITKHLQYEFRRQVIYFYKKKYFF